MSNGTPGDTSLVDVFASYLESTGSGPFPGTGPLPANPDALDKFLGMHVTDPIAAIWALLRLLATPPDAPPAPGTPLASGIAEAQLAVQQVYHALIAAGAFSPMAWLGAYIVGILVLAIAVIGELVAWAGALLLPPIAGAALTALDQTRKALDPSIAGLAVDVLNELLGTSFAATHLASGTDVASHLARAHEVGAIFHKQLRGEFSPTSGNDAVPSAVGAETFSGFLINFGTATGIIATLGGLVPFIHLDEVREIAEQVARNLGLGRLNRQVMKPLVNTYLVQPYQWYLNKLLHPTQFKITDVINPFTATLMSHAQIVAAADLEGFSLDKVEALITLHQKRLSLEDVEILKRWSYWSADVTHKYLVGLGWPEELADTAGTVPELRRIDARINKLVTFLEDSVDRGDVLAADAIALMKTLPITADELGVIQATMNARQHVPRKSLDVAQLQAAFVDGLLTIEDVQTRLQAIGYTGDDFLTLTQLTLFKLARAAEAKAVAQFKYDAAVLKARTKNLPPPPKPAILT